MLKVAKYGIIYLLGECIYGFRKRNKKDTRTK